jgi:Na+/phosphate symporter
MILLLQTLPEMPWWAALISLAIGTALGVGAGLPWRSSAMAATSRADNAEAERDSQREAKNQLLQENIQLKATVAVLEAKTDLNGLRAQVAKEMKEMRDEFKSHSDQDLVSNQQHIEAVNTLKTSVNLVLEQMKK